MEEDTDLSLGQTAEDFYQAQAKDRTGPVEVARRLADITIPSLFPPEDWDSGDDLEIVNQSVSAQCINTLANKLALSALPPNLPMAEFTPQEHKMGEDIKADPELWAEVNYSLSRLEETHRQRLKTTTARDAYGKTMKHLIGPSGNACVLWTDIDRPRVYNMHQYVVKRDAGGEQLVVVIQDSISAAIADEDVLEAARAHRLEKGDKSLEVPGSEWTEEITVYHVQKLVRAKDGKKEFVYWQEVEGGYVVEGTEFWSDYDTPPIYAAGLVHETGSDWFLPYALDYEGDIQAVENFSAALQDGAAAMAWFLFFVNPTGMTNIRDVKEADSLDVLPGRAEDVTALQAQKGADLAVASQEFERASRRLGFAYAMQTTIQRQGERVTKEEWETMSRELDQAMGGLYTSISNGPHRWFVLRFIKLHQQEDPTLDVLPEGLIEIGVVTGLDSIGQSSDLASLKEWAQDGMEVLGPEGFAAEVNANNYLTRSAAYRGVKLDGLLKSSEQKDAQKQEMLQQQQQQTLLEGATGPIAKEGAAMIGEMMKQKQGAQNG